MAEQRMACEGCGKQFENREDLHKHEQNCPAAQSRKSGSSGRPMTHGAGGVHNRQS